MQTAKPASPASSEGVRPRAGRSPAVVASGWRPGSVDAAWLDSKDFILARVWRGPGRPRENRAGRNATRVPGTALTTRRPSPVGGGRREPPSERHWLPGERISLKSVVAPRPAIWYVSWTESPYATMPAFVVPLAIGFVHVAWSSQALPEPDELSNGLRKLEPYVSSSEAIPFASGA